MPLDPDIFLKVLEVVGMVSAGGATGAVAGRASAKKAAQPDDFAAESAKDLVQRAEARMKEYHDLRDTMNREFGRVAIEAAKLEGRVERSEKDISEAKTLFALELGKLERMMRSGFREINEKLDGLREPRDGHKRRATDDNG